MRTMKCKKCGISRDVDDKEPVMCYSCGGEMMDVPSEEHDFVVQYEECIGDGLLLASELMGNSRRSLTAEKKAAFGEAAAMMLRGVAALIEATKKE